MIALLLALLPALALGCEPADDVPPEQLPAIVVDFSLQLRAARAADDAEAAAACLVALGRIDRDLGRHAEARGRFDEALALDRKRGDEAAEASDRMQLGLSDLELGRAKAAQKHFEGAFRIYKALGDPIGAADALTNLGLARHDAWDLDDAASAFHTAAGLFAAARDPQGLGDALTNLGVVRADRGDFAGAIDALRQAIDAFDQAGDPGGRGAALHDLGNVYADLGDWEQAAALYRQARPLAATEEQRSAADEALGHLLLAQGDADGARAQFDAALAGADPTDRAGLLLNLAETEEQLGLDPTDRLRAAIAAARESGDRPTECAAGIALGDHLLALDPPAAFAAFKAAAALATRLALPDLQWRAWHGIALAEQARGAGDGLTPLRNAVELLEESRRGLQGLDPWTARQFLRDRQQVYADLVDALLASGDGASALLYSERMRSAELNGSGAPADDAERRFAELSGRQERLQQALAREEVAPESRRDGERIAALRKELADARVAFSRYVDELRSSYPDFDRLVRVDPADIEAWQRDLGPDEVVVQPIVLPDRLALLVFTAERLDSVEVAVTQAELETRIGRVLRTMRSRRLSNPERLHEHLDALGGWLWEPIARQLAGKKRVIVVAGGPLRYLPLQLARRGGRYLVEDHDVVNVANVGSLKRTNDEALRLRGDGLLALGNPDGTLPAADVEVDRLGALFPGALIRHGADASLARLTADGPGRRVVHLATHGVLDSAAPERSYIVLGGGDRLAYLDIPGLYEPLRDASLVVLSACETAVPLAPEASGSGVQGGGLEIAGLANQFRRAGVPRLLASLWQVSDESTQALMVRFYGALGEGRTPSESLAAAQRALIADPGTAHPFYWGPFVLIGTPR